MNRKLKRAVRDKMRLFNAYRKHRIPHNWEKYRLQRNLTVTIRRDAIMSYFNNKCSTGAKNTDFWPTIKPCLTNKGAKCDNTIMIRADEKIITDASHVSEHMNSLYVNVAPTIGENIDVSQKSETNVDFFSRCAYHFDKHSSIVDINNNMNTTAFSFRHTTAAKVEQILRGLNAKKATGQDRISPKLVKPEARPLSHHLANIFNQCVDTSEFTDDAKLAEVVQKRR